MGLEMTTTTIELAVEAAGSLAAFPINAWIFKKTGGFSCNVGE
jgi:hypothetical protein